MRLGGKPGYENSGARLSPAPDNGYSAACGDTNCPFKAARTPAP